MSENALISDVERENVIKESLKQLEFNNVLDFISKYCYSNLGREIIQKSFPTNDLEYLNREHTLIEEMKNLLVFETGFSLDGSSDIRNLIYKSMVENAVLNAAEILVVGDCIRSFRLIKTYYFDKDSKYPNLTSVATNLFENRILEKHISEAIDDVGEIRDTATRELHRIRTEIKEKSQRLRVKIGKILRKVTEQELVQEDFYSIREGRYVLPIKVENKRALPGIIHGISQTGSTVFLEPAEVIEMNNELSILHSEEQREVWKILSNLTKEIGTDSRQFLSSIEIIAHLDALRAKAKYALDYSGIKPVISEHAEITMKNVRHPILVHSKGLKSVIPLSVRFDEKKRGHLISGPNAGGKTVALKSIGLNIVMAMSGIFPLGECYTDYRTVFTAIGDHQSVENDLSTFSSQMLQLKRIIDNCDAKSLVLIDEIGSGTDPQEGAAIASGILDTFIELNLFFIATTHQSSLKTYALNRSEIENASLEFDEVKLKPTYKFLSGIPGNSYAFVLVENIGFSKLIINRAKKYIDGKQKELEESISVLQKYRNEAVKSRAEAEKEKFNYQKLLKDYENKNQELKAKKQEIVDKAKEEASNILRNANALVENTIREIKEQKRASSEVKKEFLSEKVRIDEEAYKIAKKKEKKPENENYETIDEPLEVGDTVITDSSNNVGTVLEIDANHQTALVDINSFKFRLPVVNLIKVKKPKEKKKSQAEYIKLDTKTRIDLRGRRAEECFKEIDEFISEAIMSNSENLTILHGKGTGALRQTIHNYLKDNPYIESYRLGELVEGGAGVTIVKLKE